MGEKYRRADLQYLDWAEKILREGELNQNERTGVGTYEFFGEPQMAYDLREEFPILTTKNVAMKPVRTELAWMLHGDTNLKYLAEHDNHIWDEWPFVSYLKRHDIEVPTQGSDEWNKLKNEYLTNIRQTPGFSEKEGELGPVYGQQWRAWQGYDGVPIDQLRNVQEQIRNIDDSSYKKYGRRLIVSAWNVGNLEAMEESGLPPCHTLFQFNASNEVDKKTGKKYLDLKLYQRSADWFLGVPFNMAQYAILLSAMAQTTNRTPRYFYHTFGNAHIYTNHVEQIQLQLTRSSDLYPQAHLELNESITDIGDFDADDFKVVGYQHHDTIKGQVAI